MKFCTKDILFLVLLLAVFWFGALYDVRLSGLYMDSVNPDYLAVQTLYPKIQNPSWRIPTTAFPILGNLYHGVQNYYFDLLIFFLLGSNIITVHIAQSIFGAASLVIIYFISTQITGSRLLSFLACLLLATDIAFLASFRTQFYIILCGETWLFASLLLLTAGEKRYFLAGVFYGLSIYGYFVMSFFAPALALLFLGKQRKFFCWWLAGLGCGLCPYLFGYASLAVAVGGVHEAALWILITAKSLAPLSSKMNFISAFYYACKCAILALNNTGNDLMIFNRALNPVWGNIKICVFLAIAAFAVIKIRRPSTNALVLLPISYIVVASFWGNRLWVHHFSVLVPLAYLLLSLVSNQLANTKRYARPGIIMFLILGIAGNLYQDFQFYKELESTGGVGKSSSALTQLAYDALRQPQTIYIFPEWGFFMSFDILTHNRVHYLLDLNDLKNHSGSKIALAFWFIKDERKYESELQDAGAQNPNRQIYKQRDGEAAFYVINAEMK